MCLRYMAACCRLAPMNTNALFSSENMSWATPPELFAALDAEFRFTLDVCATPENAKVPGRFFSPAENGLSMSWAGNVCWMNPPYGRQIGAWMAKAHREVMASPPPPHDTVVVCLVPSRTDTAWWHDHVIAPGFEVRFLRGRVKFVGAKHGAPFPSAIVVMRKT